MDLSRWTSSSSSSSSSYSSSSSAFIPPHRTQLHPRMHLFSQPPNPSKQQQQHSFHSKCLLLLASLFTVPFLFHLFSTAQKIHSSTKFTDPKSSPLFGVVINAGSAGSRVRVFEFLGDAEARIPLMDGSGSSSMKVRPGLALDPDSIAHLIAFAKRRVPKKERRNTKIQLMVGAHLNNLGPESRDKVLESCRKLLRSSGFLFKDPWARVILGEDEGFYAWVAANYALGALGSEPQETTGIVEFGGASLQVTFATKEAEQLQSSRTVKLSGVIYYLYTQSFPKFGQDAAWESLYEAHNSRELVSLSSSTDGIIGNPCIPRGYNLPLNASYAKIPTSHPAGNFSACRNEALALLKRKKDKCLHLPCKIVSSLFPESLGKPVSSENILFTSEFFGLIPKASLLVLEAAGQHYCEDDWRKLRIQHQNIDDLDLSRYCFSSAYMMALLHDSLGIPMNEKRVGFANHTGSIPLDWTFGAFIVETMLEPLELEPDNLGQIVGNESVTYFLLFAFLLTAVLAMFFVLQWQKPQLKTIYDLEKGRYIVTHVPR
ncbi:probable apyrase 6 isoform X1 [Quercus robur]|uniref:probable apyrase 6 isoform X1 n=1 Tax=Quercus robur TaxID=38942 RepID=UPI002162B347|nr:probable apyrase 6 isoform X1 [Quercus robur]